MKPNLLTRILVVGFLLGLTAQPDHAVQNRDRKTELEGWGVTSNPDGDCHFFISEGMLLIPGPGGRPHDLAAEIDITNAPRVLQMAKGDFTYNGAGLVAVFDEKNIVTLARAVLQRADGKPWPYANFEIRVAGSLERFGLESDLPIPLDRPVFLRLERRGQKMLGAASTDGINWNVLEPKTLPDNWPRELCSNLEVTERCGCLKRK